MPSGPSIAVARVFLGFAVVLQLLVAVHLFSHSGEPAGDDNSIHMAEIAGIAASLKEGDPHLWNPSANGGFASGYFYQFVPQLFTALLYLLFGWLLSLATLFKITIVLALVALPLSIYRAMQIVDVDPIAAGAAAIGASTVFATAKWGTGVDSLFVTGLYTQAFAMALYPLALAYAASYLLGGKRGGRAVLVAALCGFCHPLIAVAIAPPLLFLPWWTLSWRVAVRRSAALFGAVLFVSAPLWLPIVIHYDAFGGFPSRVAGEDGLAATRFLDLFLAGEFWDVGRPSITTAFVIVGVGALVVRRGRKLAPLFLGGFLFAGLLMLGPVVGKTRGDLIPAIRFLAPMQVLLAAAAWAGIAVLAQWFATALQQQLQPLHQSHRRSAKWFSRLLVAITAAALIIVGWQLTAGVNSRAKDQVRTVVQFPEVHAAEMRAVFSALSELPSGRVLSATEFGSRSHWWMYLPYVESGHPAVRGYGGAALQSSLNFVHLRNLNVFRDHRLWGIRYIVASVAIADGTGLGQQFEDLDAAVVYDNDVFRIYQLTSASLFAPVQFVGSVEGRSRVEKIASVHQWFGTDANARNQVLTWEKDAPVTANPTKLVVRSRQAGRASHAAEVTVDGLEPVALRLSVTFHPGWSATVDGRGVKVHRVSPAFMAVLVPPGEHVVRFSFARPWWTWALYLVVGLVVVGWWRRESWLRQEPKRGGD